MGVNQKTREDPPATACKRFRRGPSALGRAVEALLLGAGGGSFLLVLDFFYKGPAAQLLAVFVGRDLH